jgi:hypothetical protein
MLKEPALMIRVSLVTIGVWLGLYAAVVMVNDADDWASTVTNCSPNVGR